MTPTERRDWLVSLTEEQAGALSPEDRYDRIRFIREKIGTSNVEALRRSARVGSDEKTPPRPCNVIKPLVKTWQRD